MQPFLKKQKLTKTQAIAYITYLVAFIWVLLLGYLYYQYLVSQDKAPTKGWTLIEGVTSNITYIPKIKAFDDRFYKNLFFRSCLSVSVSGGKTSYDTDLCEVMTNDDKTFLVQLETTGAWSDGAPVSIDDILFTYQNIVQQNIWDLPQYRNYANIAVQKSSNSSLTVSFPQASPENIHFFTELILPVHIVKWWSWNEYTANFPLNFVTNGCASLANSRDPNSFIFNLSECPDSWLKYYQVKNYPLEKLMKDPGIVDIYLWSEAIPWYNTAAIMTNNYVWLFFNMQIGKLSIYARKNLIALTNKYLYNPENNTPLTKEHFLFEWFPTQVTDKTTISGIGAPFALTWVETLPRELTIAADDAATGSGDEYKVTPPKAYYTLARFEEPLSIKITHSEGREISEARTNYWLIIPLESHLLWEDTIALKNEENLFPWYNEISFVDVNGEIVSSIGIFYKTTYQIPKERLIHIVYNNSDAVHKHVANTMKNIFVHENLNDYFFFDAQENHDEYQKIISSKQYDITLQTLSLGFRKDISPLLLTPEPTINPSMYTNANMAAQVKEFFAAPTETQYSIMSLITKLYTTDLPFFIMGKEMKTLSWRPDITLPEDIRMNEFSFREDTLKGLVLVTKPQITKADILDWRAFLQYIKWSF